MIERNRHELGSVYTPRILADWLASLLDEFSKPSNKSSVFLDPACGDGELLQSLKKLRPKASFVGVDISKEALTIARRRKIGDWAALHCADALGREETTFEKQWEDLIGDKQICGIIANPPWGAKLKLTSDQLRKAGYELAKGQFDSSDLFIELAWRIVKPEGAIALILPDSIFQPERTALRKFLCTKSHVRLIARLGEGIFDGVYRGTTVIVLTKLQPQGVEETECLRVTKKWREQIKSGQSSFSEARKALSHKVPQSRFTKDDYRFDIDLQEHESVTVSLMDRYVDGWTNWLETARGVELSKTGKVIVCPNCDFAHQVPRGIEGVKCKNCGASLDNIKVERIIAQSPTSKGKWRPIIVGEDVDRYHAAASRFIRTDVSGIKYKSDIIFDGRKIVVRKTGVGIKAAIDESEALTNQVVFIYKLNKKMKAPSFLLDYFLGTLCSRPMLAYYLKTKGESEWRSHAYLTQKVIAALPVPNIQEGTAGWKQARAISAAVKERARRPSLKSDLYVDSLVAGLFGMSEQDCQWCVNVFENAQGLEPIRTMRLERRQSFSPVLIQ